MTPPRTTIQKVLDNTRAERDSYRLLTSIALEQLHETEAKLKRTQDSLYALLDSQRK